MYDITFLKHQGGFIIMNNNSKLAKKFFVGMVTTAVAINAFGAMTASAADTASHIGTAATTYVNSNKGTHPDSTDRASIKVYGIDDTQATVVAYHVIEANYNQYGLTGYTQTAATYNVSDATKIKGFDKVTSNVMNVLTVNNDKTSVLYNGGNIITEENISSIASAIISGKSNPESITLTYNSTSGAYETDQAKAGTYIVLVRKTSDGAKTVYNPMVVSNDYTDANDSLSLGADVAVKTGIHKDDDDNTSTTDYSHSFVGSDGKRYYQNSESNGNVYISGTIGDIAAGDVDVNGEVNSHDVDYLTNYLTDNEGSALTDRGRINADMDSNGVINETDADLLKTYVQFLADTADLDPIKDTDAYLEKVNALPASFPKDILSLESIATMSLQGRAYAKKDTIPFEKNIVNASTADGLSDIDYSKYDDLRITKDGNGNVEAVQATFDLQTEVPDYSDIYFAADSNFKYVISDTLSEGLNKVSSADVKVYVEQDSQLEAEKTNPTYAEDVAKYLIEEGKGTVLTDGKEYTFSTVTNNDGSSTFSLTFDQDWITSVENANKKVVVRYSTYLNDKAVKGLDGNVNDAQLEFTTVPGDTDIEYDYTTHYTFPVIVTKVKENGSVTVKDSVIDNEDVVSDLEVDRPLAGAKFNIVKIKDITLGEDGKEIITDSKEGYKWTLTSDENGVLQFDSEEDGLDEGIYTLVEYEAPKGYTLNDKIYLVKISAQYDTDRQRFTGDETAATDAEHRFIKSFTVSVLDDGVTGTDFLSDIERSVNAKDYDSIDWTQVSNDKFADISADAANNSIVYTWKDAENDVKEVSVVATAIPNTQLSRLPSTGGAGTIAFTVGGFTLMGGAFLLTKKRKARKAAEAAAETAEC
jgi:LPXTG-motif cell wall-anchored protein